MSRRIIVINPNSTESVTEGIDEAVAPLRMAGGPEIEAVTLAEGPPGIESQTDVESVVAPLCGLIRARDDDAAAFVIACYSDPGLYAAREATRWPVFGIAECGMLNALMLGEKFGVIAILSASIPRHARHVRALGLESRFAGEAAIEMGIAGLADGDEVLRRMGAVGRRLRDEHGCDVVIMGCAGLARYRSRLEDALNVPVVEPTQAAVTMAIGAARLGS
ncbi:MAG: aspartate/glutamate racemase family protein [Candidatus Hydrogenedentes bacterium]|nr:aspartate/glutamate racemase family protein [Candidatus Hydrogenedentota bacterium]